MSTLSRRDLLVGTASAFGAASCAPAIPDAMCAPYYVTAICPAPSSDGAAAPAPPPGGTSGCELFAYDEIERASPNAVIHPACEAELVDFFAALARAPGARTVTVRGGGLSLDSQSLGKDIVLIIDQKDFCRIERPGRDKDGFYMTVGAGARWWDVIAICARFGLMPPSLQTGGDATVGGTLSADCVSRMSAIVGKEGSHVRNFRIVLPSGEVVSVSRGSGDIRQQELYSAVIGGFGYLGVVTEVTFDLIAARDNANVRGPEPRVFTRATRYPATCDWDAVFRSLQSRSREGRLSYMKQKASYHGSSLGDGSTPPVATPEWSALSVACFLTGYSLEANLLEQRYTLDPLRPTPGGIYARDGSINAFAERVDSFWPTAAELVLDFGWPQGEFVDDLFGWAFFFGNSTKRAKADAHALGYRLNCIQQSFVLPSGPENHPPDTRPAQRFIELVLARSHAADLRPGPIDFLYVGDDDDTSVMSASRGLPGFVITLAFADRDRTTLRPPIDELLRALSSDCRLLGGRVHLVKNVAADRGDLRAMHGDAAKRFRELKAKYDPGGVFRNDFFSRVFEA
ncbi:MAG TPA: FAD-binding oxidoreductase [Polyangiaceae bacterium]|jgi:FAD/FMN-containing dehydrogenase|nr:FAD-binding oxidoreductase [Polyangiaceae bacterium]